MLLLMVGPGDLRQRLPVMTVLPAGLAAGLLAQRARLRFPLGKPIGRGGLRGILRGPIDLRLQLGDPRNQLSVVRLRLGKPGPKARHQRSEHLIRPIPILRHTRTIRSAPSHHRPTPRFRRVGHQPDTTRMAYLTSYAELCNGRRDCCVCEEIDNLDSVYQVRRIFLPHIPVTVSQRGFGHPASVGCASLPCRHVGAVVGSAVGTKYGEA